MNKQSLRALALKKGPQQEFWQGIQEDVAEIEKYLGFKLEPETRDQIEHQKISAKVLQNLNLGKSTKDLVEKGAHLRKSLG